MLNESGMVEEVVFHLKCGSKLGMGVGKTAKVGEKNKTYEFKDK